MDASQALRWSSTPCAGGGLSCALIAFFFFFFLLSFEIIYIYSLVYHWISKYSGDLVHISGEHLPPLPPLCVYGDRHEYSSCKPPSLEDILAVLSVYIISSH